jgi:hypothetical protein
MTLSKIEKEKVEVDIYKYKWLLKYNNNSKVKMASMIKNIFGIRFTAKLLYIFLKYKEKKI